MNYPQAALTSLANEALTVNNIRRNWYGGTVGEITDGEEIIPVEWTYSVNMWFIPATGTYLYGARAA